MDLFCICDKKNNNAFVVVNKIIKQNHRLFDELPQSEIYHDENTLSKHVFFKLFHIEKKLS